MTVYILTEESNATGESTVLGVFATAKAAEQARARVIAVAHAGRVVVYDEDTVDDDWGLDFAIVPFPVEGL